MREPPDFGVGKVGQKSSVRVGRMMLVSLFVCDTTTGVLPVQTQRRSAVKSDREISARTCLSQGCEPRATVYAIRKPALYRQVEPRPRYS